MPAKAKISKGYLWRVGIIALVFLGFAGCSFNDGRYKYPNINRMHDVIDQFKQEHPDDWADAWPDFARQNGYPDTLDKLPSRKSRFDIYSQFFYLALTGPIGLLYGYWFLSQFGRWIASDENGLTNSRGQTIAFDSIKSINKKRWARKGIAVVTFDHEGSEQRFVIDDWKYERGPTDQVLIDIEERLKPDQIIDDIPEAEKQDQEQTDEAETAETNADETSEQTTS